MSAVFEFELLSVGVRSAPIKRRKRGWAWYPVLWEPSMTLERPEGREGCSEAPAVIRER